LHYYSQTRASEFEGREKEQTAAAKQLDEGKKSAKKGRYGKVFVKINMGKSKSKTITKNVTRN
jgi:hypothetical protein